ncbi:hypothetical protein [Flavobacterium soyae]|uniref:Chaperone of endosialidase n=1 Tax=Flavobacterium soyae TaxID=2903098 RepID=A0ABZ2UK03_9FLAO
MKNYKLIALLFITYPIFSQNTFPTSGEVNFDTSLKIGTQVSPTQEGQIIRLVLQPYRHTGGPWNFKSRDSNTYGAFLDFDYGTTGTALTMSSDRKIGINSLTPLNTFEVKVPTSTGASSSDGISIHDGASYRLGLNIGVNSTDEYSYLQAVKGGIGQKNIAINPIGGNVGVGTISPVSKLSVFGSLTLNGGLSNTLQRPSINAGTLTYGEIRGFSNSVNSALGDDGFLRISAGGGTNSNTKSFIDLTGYSTIPDMNRNIVFGTLGLERMRVDINGNVGIGTITTGSHKLAVEGSIGAREIKVQATGWSDFVFKKEYDLPTLEQVEKHINEKGHLKDIPSEEEVLKNGINLGEMNSKLLQKIEELTLYIIEIKKENAKENEKQNEEIKNLKIIIASKK